MASFPIILALFPVALALALVLLPVLVLVLLAELDAGVEVALAAELAAELEAALAEEPDAGLTALADELEPDPELRRPPSTVPGVVLVVVLAQAAAYSARVFPDELFEV
jgi:hypothetical protein